MSSLFDTLRAIGVGREPGRQLLQSCRFEGLGGRTFGRESILDWMRRQPIELTSAIAIVDSNTGFALFGLGAADEAPIAFFGDQFDEGIGRLWYLSGASPIDSNAAFLDVASDIDLDQRGETIHFEPPDHPDLRDVDIDLLHDTIGRTMTDLHENTVGAEGIRLLRARAFVRRAFSDDRGGAALLGIDAVVAGDVRKPLRFNVAVLFDRRRDQASQGRIVVDQAGFRTALRSSWLPRIGQRPDHCAAETAL